LWYIRKLVVDTIDSVFIGNKYLKRFVLTYVNECSGEQWIEGIGSLCGIFEIGTYCNTGGTFRLLCYYENDTLEYSNPNFAGCYYNGTDDGFETIELSGLKVNVFPNPSTNFITIESPQAAIMEILDILGQTIMQKTVPQGKADIDISGLAKGVYILRLCSNDKTEVTKIVKE
jgi:hypothetical protein